MSIKNYAEKRDAGLIEREFSTDNSISVLERQFNQRSGIKEFVDVGKFTSSHIDELIEDKQRQIDQVATPLNQDLADLTALRADVFAMEQQRAAAEAEAKAKGGAAENDVNNTDQAKASS